MPTSTPAQIYQLKVTLIGIDPPIWRRLRVPSARKLCCLHDALQVSIGWSDSHAHQFEKDGKQWSVPEWDEFGDLELLDESKVTVSSLISGEGDSMTYLYDFGDHWQHEIVLEKIAQSDGSTKPVCIAGERHCPPEDVGGPEGYKEFLEVIFQPDHEEFGHYRQWAGKEVHAEDFDLNAVNKKLSRMRWPRKHKR